MTFLSGLLGVVAKIFATAFVFVIAAAGWLGLGVRSGGMSYAERVREAKATDINEINKIALVTGQAKLEDSIQPCLSLKETAFYWKDKEDLGIYESDWGVIAVYPRLGCLSDVMQATQKVSLCPEYAVALSELEGQTDSSRQDYLTAYCVLGLAQRTHDADLCTHSSEERNCRALTLNDSTFCYDEDGAADQHSSSCLTNIAKQTLDPSFCEQITPDTDSGDWQWQRNWCFGYVTQETTQRGGHEESRELSCALLKKYELYDLYTEWYCDKVK